MAIIDLHCDTADKLYQDQGDFFKNDYHIDLSKLKKGQYAAQWFALFTDVETVQGPLMDYVIQMRQYFLRELKKYEADIGLATSYEDYKALRSQNKIAAFLSLEEAAAIEKVEDLEKLWQLGIRMMTLTWNYKNQLGAPHSMAEGLSSFGKEIVETLNHYNILLDISHLSESCVWELASIYKKPIMASHCNAYSIHAHSRNLSDRVIKLIAETGGVIGLNFYGLFINGSQSSSIEALLKHLDHFYQIGGKEILALGTDYDGMNCDLEVCNAGEMGKLIEMLYQKYPSDLVEAITYKNAERLIKENL